MSISRINPASLYDSVSYGFSHATLDQGGKTLHLAGQVAWNADYVLIGDGDLAAQTRQVLANLKTVLAEAGAGPADIIRLRTYIVNHSPDKLGVVLPEIASFYEGADPAPNTLIGVAALALPEFLIEIEATATVA
ncbi:RidA family protein [Sphingomonas sp.]|uniref:RidA family protein n=1 Tax=Sphingomonas sp. TaxID=28214 RepID=UPI003B3A8A2D